MLEKLAQGREAYRRREWEDAYQFLSLADQSTPLGFEDLELLSTATYLTGRDIDFHRLLDRIHHAHMSAGNREGAARSAFLLGLMLLLRGETGQATGWLARARRLIEGRDCVEQGYVLLPVAEQELAKGHADQAQNIAISAAEIGDRFGDADLVACARHIQGRALLGQGNVRDGLAILDEAMVSVVSGELTPIFTGLIYCSVIEACQQVVAWSRAREWTSALARWCEQQPQMVPFTGTCLVYRAEILQFHGAWPEALAEAQRASERSSHGNIPALASYRQAEIHRLRGDFALAEEEYRKAAQLGRDPQPGLALMRMAQGRADAASASIRRVLNVVTDSLERAKLLPPYIEIMLATGESEDARSACRELEQIAEGFATEVLQAMSAQAQGTVALAEGDARAALEPLRSAFQTWRQVEAPYELARVRALLGAAFRSLGDEEAAALEISSAREAFKALGAVPEFARLDSIAQGGAVAHSHGLTPRELQVLRLLAAGKTNRAIATELFLSERTIDRHVSNILTKLDVPSRVAATSWAYDHKLL